MALADARAQVLDAEKTLAERLLRTAEAHADEVDVYHVAHTLVRRGELQLARLQNGDAGPRAAAPAPALLADLEALYLETHRTELAWVMLVQAAKAARDAELLAVAEAGREEAERRWKWVRTKIKESTPQALLAS